MDVQAVGRRWRSNTAPHTPDLHARFQVPGSSQLFLGFRVSDPGFRVSGFGLQVSGFEFQVSGFRLRVAGFGLQVSGSGFQTSGFGVRASGFRFQISDLGLQVPGFGVRASGFGCRVYSGRGPRGEEEVEESCHEQFRGHVLRVRAQLTSYLLGGIQ